MDPEDLRRLVEADGVIQASYDDAASAGVRAAMGSVADWYDHAEVSAAAAHAGGVVQSASSLAAASADAYLTMAIAEVTGRSATPAGVISIHGPLREGVRGWPAVYERVAETVRLEVSRGKPLEDAVRIGLQRGDAMSRADIGLARRQQWRSTLTANPEIIGFRRVIHPELSKGGTCGLCIAASDRRYTRSQLLPLHDRCKCTVAPITQVHDPGMALNDADLGDLYGDAGSTYGVDLKRTRYRVVEHGELGPRLVHADHHFRGPTDVAAA